MTFNLLFEQMFETNEEATQRLAQSPEWSENHTLSKMPSLHWPPFQGIYYLPRTQLAVIVIDQMSQGEKGEDGRRLQNASFRTKVVWSKNPSYPVGGHDLCVGEQELRRSTRVNMNAAIKSATTPAAINSVLEGIQEEFIRWCPIEGCDDSWETEPTCEHNKAFQYLKELLEGEV